MNVVGIISEYNPFHNGHIYHINKIKELYPNSIIICVTSSSFTQRGELSILNKWEKTNISLNNNIDLVIELPYFFTVQSADIFAHAALQILNSFKIDTLIFGSESNDIELLKKYASNNNYEDKLPPNDILGISYIKEIVKNKYNINPITIKRTNDYHHEGATSIRMAIKNKQDISTIVPKETLDKIISFNIEDNYFKLLKYKILSEINILNTYLDVDEGLDNLIKKNIIKANSLNELIESIKTKRYTYNRLNRMFIHILLNIKKSDVKKRKEINYIRILGFNKLGKKYLKELKGHITIPLITNYSDLDDDNLNFELYVTTIYNEIINRNDLNIIELKSIPKES